MWHITHFMILTRWIDAYVVISFDCKDILTYKLIQIIILFVAQIA